jgi:predicted HicB family RNase H-like nuclease
MLQQTVHHPGSTMAGFSCKFLVQGLVQITRDHNTKSVEGQKKRNNILKDIYLKYMKDDIKNTEGKYSTRFLKRIRETLHHTQQRNWKQTDCYALKHWISLSNEVKRKHSAQVVTRYRHNDTLDSIIVFIKRDIINMAVTLA